METVHGPLGAVGADDDDRDVAAHGDQLAIGVPRDVAVAHLTLPSKFDSMKD